MKREINKGLTILLISFIIIGLGGSLLVKAQEDNKDFEVTADQMVLEKDKLIAEGNVQVNSSQGKMTGAKFRLNNSTKSGILTGNPILENKGWKVDGNKFEIDFDTKELFVPAKAHIESKNLVADADQLRFLSQKDQAVLTGNVLVINQERRLTGKEVIINLETEKITSTGRTKLTFPSDELNTEGKKNDN